MAGTTESQRARKGKNFSSEEERQVCRSFLQITQDPVVGNGQRSKAFWERVGVHYNRNRPAGGGERPARSLETKWGIIKHDVAKFVGVYKQVYDCRESGTSLDDVLQNALELYKVKHAKQQSFVFLHCWLLLRDIPRWMESVPESRQRQAGRSSPAPAPKRKTPPVETDGDDDVGFVSPAEPSEEHGAHSCASSLSR